MATKEENQLLINEFVTRNVDAINTLESAKQKAVLDAIILIQNKFGTIQQSIFKEDVIVPEKEEKIEFRLGDRFQRKNDILKVYGLKDGEFQAKRGDEDLGWFNFEEVKKHIEDGSWVRLPRELPFKVGDIFKNWQNEKITFEVLEIDDDKNIVKVKRTDTKGDIKEKDYEIDDFVIDIEAGFKILVKKLPFEVGDKIYNKNTPNNINTIIGIGETKDFFKFKTQDGRVLIGSIEDAIEDVENGDLIVIKAQPLLFKVGDKFYAKPNPQNINTILNIDESKNYFELENDQGLKLNGFSLQEAIDYFKDGHWVLVQPQAQPQATKFKFEIGDTFEQKGTTMQYTIIDIIEGFDQYVVQKSSVGYPTNINRTSFEEDVEKGRLVQIFVNQPSITPTFKFQIGDKFEQSINGNTWEIIDIIDSIDQYELEKNKPNGGITHLQREEFEKLVEDGRIKQIFVNQPFTSTTTTTTTLPSASASTSGTSGSSSISMSTNKEQEIKDLEDAIDTQKLLLTLADTKQEKDEIKELLKDLRAQLKKLKK